MAFPSFFEIEGPELAPIEFEKWNSARNKAILLLNSTDEKSNDEQKKLQAAAIKRANALENIAYDAYQCARAKAYGR